MLHFIDTPDKCEDAKCNEETEICTVLDNDEVTVALCVPTGEYACMHICYGESNINLQTLEIILILCHLLASEEKN